MIDFDLRGMELDNYSLRHRRSSLDGIDLDLDPLLGSSAMDLGEIGIEIQQELELADGTPPHLSEIELSLTGDLQPLAQGGNGTRAGVDKTLAASAVGSASSVQSACSGSSFSAVAPSSSSSSSSSFVAPSHSKAAEVQATRTTVSDAKTMTGGDRGLKRNAGHRELSSSALDLGFTWPGSTDKYNDEAKESSVALGATPVPPVALEKTGSTPLYRADGKKETGDAPSVSLDKQMSKSRGGTEAGLSTVGLEIESQASGKATTASVSKVSDGRSAQFTEEAREKSGPLESRGRRHSFDLFSFPMASDLEVDELQRSLGGDSLSGPMSLEDSLDMFYSHVIEDFTDSDVTSSPDGVDGIDSIANYELLDQLHPGMTEGGLHASDGESVTEGRKRALSFGLDFTDGPLGPTLTEAEQLAEKKAEQQLYKKLRMSIADSQKKNEAKLVSTSPLAAVTSVSKAGPTITSSASSSSPRSEPSSSLLSADFSSASTTAASRSQNSAVAVHKNASKSATSKTAMTTASLSKSPAGVTSSKYRKGGSSLSTPVNRSTPVGTTSPASAKSGLKTSVTAGTVAVARGRKTGKASDKLSGTKKSAAALKREKKKNKNNNRDKGDDIIKNGLTTKHMAMTIIKESRLKELKASRMAALAAAEAAKKSTNEGTSYGVSDDKTDLGDLRDRSEREFEQETPENEQGKKNSPINLSAWAKYQPSIKIEELGAAPTPKAAGKASGGGSGGGSGSRATTPKAAMKQSPMLGPKSPKTTKSSFSSSFAASSTSLSSSSSSVSSSPSSGSDDLDDIFSTCPITAAARKVGYGKVQPRMPSSSSKMGKSGLPSTKLESDVGPGGASLATRSPGVRKHQSSGGWLSAGSDAEANSPRGLRSADGKLTTPSAILNATHLSSPTGSNNDSSSGGGNPNGNITTAGSDANKASAERKIGAYTLAQRKLRIELFLEKRQKRVWKKRIKYDCRKKLADDRPRIKGRFVKRLPSEEEEERMKKGAQRAVKASAGVTGTASIGGAGASGGVAGKGTGASVAVAGVGKGGKTGKPMGVGNKPGKNSTKDGKDGKTASKSTKTTTKASKNNSKTSKFSALGTFGTDLTSTDFLSLSTSGSKKYGKKRKGVSSFSTFDYTDTFGSSASTAGLLLGTSTGGRKKGSLSSTSSLFTSTTPKKYGKKNLSSSMALLDTFAPLSLPKTSKKTKKRGTAAATVTASSTPYSELLTSMEKGASSGKSAKGSYGKRTLTGSAVSATSAQTTTNSSASLSLSSNAALNKYAAAVAASAAAKKKAANAQAKKGKGTKVVSKVASKQSSSGSSTTAVTSPVSAKKGTPLLSTSSASSCSSSSATTTSKSCPSTPSSVSVVDTSSTTKPVPSTSSGPAATSSKSGSSERLISSPFPSSKLGEKIGMNFTSGRFANALKNTAANASRKAESRASALKASNVLKKGTEVVGSDKGTARGKAPTKKTGLDSAEGRKTACL